MGALREIIEFLFVLCLMGLMFWGITEIIMKVRYASRSFKQKRQTQTRKIFDKEFEIGRGSEPSKTATLIAKLFEKGQMLHYIYISDKFALSTVVTGIIKRFHELLSAFLRNSANLEQNEVAIEFYIDTTLNILNRFNKLDSETKQLEFQDKILPVLTSVEQAFATMAQRVDRHEEIELDVDIKHLKQELRSRGF